MNAGVWWAVSIVTVLSKHQNIMRSHRRPGRCIIAVKSVSVSPAHKHKDTYTQMLLKRPFHCESYPFPNHFYWNRATTKNDTVTAKISKCPVTPQLGLLCLPSTEKQIQVREKKRDRERTRERENWCWKKRVKEREEGVSICPSPGSHWSVGSEGWEHRKSVGIPRRPRKGKQSLCFSPCPII